MTEYEYKKDELPTVSDLAIKTGQTFHKYGKDGKLYLSVASHDCQFKRDHLVADVIHGWTLYSNKGAEPMRLSEDDYLAAIEAAKIGKKHTPAIRTPEEVI